MKKPKPKKQQKNINIYKKPKKEAAKNNCGRKAQRTVNLSFNS